MNIICRIFLPLLLTILLSACGAPESTPTNAVAIPDYADPGIIAKGLDYEIYRDSVEPIFLRHRGGFVGSDTSCVACHTSQANACPGQCQGGMPWH